ncbi:3-methyladenine DNA glycosylase AlkC [Lentzea albidocapillata subsp. violacea]|uniref:3-methyladenine DNA glycosylase AlkC n=1 Tax=Lentzea albidocapillata subsp. violacea TaxID=128104 RepID=A0A1G8UAC0_9PSEU|nr:DNA alkylation repair protein [Lentzea albidocapillata]SDJ50554.1 3-methyladenine DNA glycosylase AlkC [Lentzea albidocapillata subsp. violacea]
MPFADELIGAPAVSALTAALRSVSPGARLPRLSAAGTALAPLALRERSDLIRDALLADLPGDYASFARTVRAAAGAPAFTGWLIWPVTSAVAAKAIDEGGVDAFDDALALLAELTPRLTSEFALRALLGQDLGRALATILLWTRSESADVRRLASEGTRPLLPWAVRVPGILAEPKATLPILDALYRDESEYVRRSVANHLNDISRRDPELVVATASEWMAAPDDNTARVVRHGLRTLVKQGHPGALEVLGFTSAHLDVTGPLLTSGTVVIGETLSFTGSVRNLGQEPARLVIDYVVHHVKANGTLTAKTFKLTTRTVEPGETYELSRAHSFRVLTTRRYHPGRHAVELQVNGVRSGRAEFTLVAVADEG